jgi:hypothetical protein
MSVVWHSVTFALSRRQSSASHDTYQLIGTHGVLTVNWATAMPTTARAKNNLRIVEGEGVERRQGSGATRVPAPGTQLNASGNTPQPVQWSRQQHCGQQIDSQRRGKESVARRHPSTIMYEQAPGYSQAGSTASKVNLRRKQAYLAPFGSGARSLPG